MRLWSKPGYHKKAGEVRKIITGHIKLCKKCNKWYDLQTNTECPWCIKKMIQDGIIPLDEQI